MMIGALKVTHAQCEYLMSTSNNMYKYRVQVSTCTNTEYK